jgi:hypothetical protein
VTLFQAPLLTNGATHPAQQFRMMIRDLARGNEGITEGDDLKVTALSTPGTSVKVSDGSGVVRGKANTFQGSYAVCNIGTPTVAIAATGGSPRSDMVVLRVLDPEYEGTLNPAVDQIEFFDIVSNVSSTATQVPAGYTAIPLARIDIPASTSVITNAMITDLRQCANPRRQRDIYIVSPTSMSTEIAGLRYSTGLFFGNLRSTFGSSLTTQSVVLDDNGGTGVRRGVALTADTLAVPSTYRGTNQLLRPQASGAGGNAGKVSIDASSTVIADVEYLEAPR